MTNKTMTTLLLSLLGITLGYVPNRGLFWDDGGIILISAGLMALIFTVRTPSHKKVREDGYAVLLSFCGFMMISLSIFFDGGMYIKAEGTVSLMRTLHVFILLLYSSYIVDTRNLDYGNGRWLSRYRFYAILTVAALNRVLTIIYSPSPVIDTFWFMNEGAAGFLQGKNPYAMTFTDIYNNGHSDYYVYLPATLLMTLPGYLLFGDIRYSYIMAEFLSAFFIYKILTDGAAIDRKRRISAELVTILYLFNPLSLFMIEQSWVEPLNIMVFTAFLYFYFKKDAKLIGSVLLGVALATKQYMLLAVPFLIRTGRVPFKKLLIPGTIFLALCLPFFLWSPSDFINDNILHHIRFKPPYYMLTLNTFYHKYIGGDLPRLAVTAIVSSVFIITISLQRRNIISFMTAFSATLLSTFLTYQASANYYSFISAMILIAIAFHISGIDSEKI